MTRAYGSTNVIEFLVTTTISATFILTLGHSELKSAVGLILGGILAASIGGYVVSRIPTRPVMLAVGLVIIASTAINLV